MSKHKGKWCMYDEEGCDCGSEVFGDAEEAGSSRSEFDPYTGGSPKLEVKRPLPFSESVVTDLAYEWADAYSAVLKRVRLDSSDRAAHEAAMAAADAAFSEAYA